MVFSVYIFSEPSFVVLLIEYIWCFNASEAILKYFSIFVIEIKLRFMFLDSCNCTTWLNTAFKTDRLREECALVL